MQAILEQLQVTDNQGALLESLLAGGWWVHCRALMREDADRDSWLDGLPGPDLPVDELERWRLGQCLTDRLEQEVKGTNRPKSPQDLERRQYTRRQRLRILASQLHCVRLALALPKSFTAADWLERSPAHPFEDTAQEGSVQALANGLGRNVTEVRYWVLNLLRGEAGIQQQRIDGLWVQDPKDPKAAGVIELILSVVPGLPESEPDRLLTHPASALVGTDRDFQGALRNGWQAARSLLGQEDCPWPADAGLAWRLAGRGELRLAIAEARRSAAPPPALNGASAGGAVALAAYLLGRRAHQAAIDAQGRPAGARRRFTDDLLDPLLDPEATKGVAVSAEIADPASAAFREVGGLSAKLKAASLLGVHTVIDAGTQDIKDLEGLRVVSPDQAHAFVSRVEDPALGRPFTVLRAQSLAQAVSRLDTHLREGTGKARFCGGGIARFLDWYLGTPTRPAPFGGRDEPMARLDAWLADSDLRCLLLAAPAGRGKSALLAQWVARIWLRPDIALVFLPISIRFNTNLRRTIAEVLLTRLAAIHGEPIAWGDKDAPLDVWLERIQAYLRRPLADGRTLVLVIDGLDEAADWLPDPGFFPADPPEGVRIVIAARYLVRDSANPQGWLDRLGWKATTTEAPDLDPLDAAGLTDVLERIGFPPSQLADPHGVVDRLLELTQGDPLLVRFYVQDLQDLADPAALTLDYFTGIEPGLRGYYCRWLERQVSNSDALWQDHVHKLLAVLATALGPIDAADLTRLAGVPMDTDVLAAVRRWVVGDGQDQGLVLSHSRLGDFYRTEEMDERERDAVEAGFLAWGKATLDGLNSWVKHRRAEQQEEPFAATVEPIKPEVGSAYLIQCYGRHLERWHRQYRSTASLDALAYLVTEGWLRAWEYFEGGTYSGFLADVDTAWMAATQADLEAAEQHRPLPRLGTEIRCALCHTSVNSLAKSLGPEMITASVKADVWSPAQGLSSVRRIVNERDKVEALTNLAPDLPPVLLPEILDVARALSAECRAEVLTSLVCRLPSVQAGSVLAEALAAAAAIPSEPSRAGALVALAPRLPPALLPAALEAARTISDNGDRSKALTGLALHLSAGRARVALAGALAAARAISDEKEKADALSTIVPNLPSALAHGALAEALDAARKIPYGLHRVEALAGLAVHLPVGKAPAVLAEALAAAQAISDEEDRSQALATVATVANVATNLPSDQTRRVLAEALVAARTISDEQHRARALAALAPRLPSSLLPEALSGARTISDERYWAQAIAALAPHLPTDAVHGVLAKALALARAFAHDPHGSEALAHAFSDCSRLTEGLVHSLSHDLRRTKSRAAWPKKAHVAAFSSLLFNSFSDMVSTRVAGELAAALAAALATLACHIPPNERVEVLDQALAAARTISGGEHRVKALAGIAHHLPPDQISGVLAEALDAARSLPRSEDRAKALATLVPHLPPDLLPAALAAAIATEPRERRYAFASLAPRLPPALLVEALNAARSIFDESDRIRALATLAPYLPPNQVVRALGEAMVAARVLPDQGERVKALATLAAHLPPALLPEALETALAISDEKHRAAALGALAPHLLPGERVGNETTSSRKLFLLAFRPDRYRRIRVLKDALAGARAIVNQEFRAGALTALAPHIPIHQVHGVLYEALAAAREISLEDDKAAVLCSLAHHLPTDRCVGAKRRFFLPCFLFTRHRDRHRQVKLLKDMLATARAIVDEKYKAQALTSLAPHLPANQVPEVLAEALSVARMISDERSRIYALTCLAPHLPLSLLPEALAVAQRISIADLRAYALAALAPHLPPSLLPEALASARAISTGQSRATALAALVPYLEPPLLTEALTVARAIHFKVHRTKALAAIAPQLPPHHIQEVFAEALATARTISNKWDRVKTLTALATRLPPDQIPRVLAEALDAARTFPRSEDRANALTALAPDMPPELLHKALAAARTIGDEECKVRVLATLAPLMSPNRVAGVFTEALAAAREISHHPSWAKALNALAPQCPSSVLPQFIRAYQSNTRESLLNSIAEGTGVRLIAAGVPSTAREIVQAISDTCRWWP